MIGEKINIFGIQATVAADEECAQAEFMLCSTKKRHDEAPENHIPGTIGGYFCMGCNTELVAAPSGQKIIAMGNTRTICIECVVKIQDDNA